MNTPPPFWFGDPIYRLDAKSNGATLVTIHSRSTGECIGAIHGEHVDAAWAALSAGAVLRQRVDRLRAAALRAAADLARLPGAHVAGFGRELIDREQAVQIALTLKAAIDEDGLK